MLATSLRAALVVALVGSASMAGAADRVSEQLTVSRAVKNALPLKVADLSVFPKDQIVTLTDTRRVGDRETAASVRGVKLTAVLDRAVLAAREGRIALISAHDLRTGPRSVHWLTRLDVRVLQE